MQDDTFLQAAYLFSFLVAGCRFLGMCGFFAVLVLSELMPSTFANCELGSVRGGRFHLLFTEIVSMHCSTLPIEGLCNKTPQDMLKIEKLQFVHRWCMELP